MSPNPVEINLPAIGQPFSLYLHEDNELFCNSVRRNKTYEPMETRLVVSTLQEGDVFLDIGANVGWYSVIAARKVGASGKVIAFEPDPDNFGLLKKNCELNKLGNVELHNRAISDCDGKDYLYRSTSNFGDHQLHATADESRAKVEVETVKLDSLFPAGDIAIKAIKIDTQGSEAKIMRGMQTFIARQKPVIFTEFWPYGLRNNGESVFDILAFIERNGYLVFEMRHNSLNDLTPGLVYEMSRERLHPGTRNFTDLLLLQPEQAQRMFGQPASGR